MNFKIEKEDIVKQKIIDRIKEMKKQSNMRFANCKKTYFGENMNEIDIRNIDEDMLIGLFEQMVRIHYLHL